MIDSTIMVIEDRTIINVAVEAQVEVLLMKSVERAKACHNYHLKVKRISIN